MPQAQRAYRFAPGQFNMLYLVRRRRGADLDRLRSAGRRSCSITPSARVGRVTNGLAALRPGDRIGVRGPYGRGWPLDEAGGPGRADHHRRARLRADGLGDPLSSCGGARASDGSRSSRASSTPTICIWRQRYDDWAREPDTQVLLAADVGGPLWPWHVGRVTELFEHVAIDPARTLAMLCGPEGMMTGRRRSLCASAVCRRRRSGSAWSAACTAPSGTAAIASSAPKFVCQDGPVFRYAEVKPLLGCAMDL